MISRSRLDRLTGALMLDKAFRESFLTDRLGAIQNYNLSYALRFRERPIELNDDEQQLILSLSATSVPDFVEQLEDAISRKGLVVFYPKPHHNLA